MKLLIVAPRLPPNISGGGEISLQTLLEKLDVDYEILTATNYPSKEFLGHKVHSCLPISQGKLVRRIIEPLFQRKSEKIIWEKTREIKPDIIYSANMEYNLPISKLSIPKVATINAWNDTCITRLQSLRGADCNVCHFIDSIRCLLRSKGYRKIGAFFQPLLFYMQVTKRRALQKYDLVIAPSENVETVLQYNSIKSTYLPLPLNTELFKRQENKKHTDVLLPALKDYRKGSTLKKSLLEQLDQENITYELVTGKDYWDMPKYYSSARVTCCPYVWNEPIGRIPLESMACETPCVVTNRGGLVESVPVEHICSLYVDQIVNKIKHVLENQYLDETGRRLRKQVIEKHDSVMIAKRFEKLLEETVSGTRKIQKTA